MEFINGKTYQVVHSRKGTFDLRITKQTDTWLTGTVVAGVPGSRSVQNKGAVCFDANDVRRGIQNSAAAGRG